MLKLAPEQRWSRLDKIKLDCSQVSVSSASYIPDRSSRRTAASGTVTILDVNETTGKSLKEALDKQYGPERTVFLKCDVESEEQVKAALQKTVGTFGGINIVCNNAGILNEGEWEKTVAINLTGVIRVTYLALEHMNKLTGGQGGVFINTASRAGYGVQFNALCPSFVQTDLLSNILNRLGPFSHLADATNQLMEKSGMLKVVEAQINGHREQDDEQDGDGDVDTAGRGAIAMGTAKVSHHLTVSGLEGAEVSGSV
ncbi:hypothetical protein INR49_009532 [Caranx melampygus]|nr:hypothetical protein INR49_009532 [Caranx melampygus]